MSANVLVIDDEPMFQDLTRSVLSIAEYRVDVASNGFEALKLLGQSEFDAIIVDYHLPEMDGYALARLLIEHTRYRQRRPALVALTADPDGLAVRRGSDAIFASILAKPVAPRQLLLAIEHAIKGAQGVGELGAAAAALVTNPDSRTASEASRAFWREAGLPDRPRALVLPPPTRDQSAALTICFDLCGEAENPDVLITTDPSRLAAHAAALGPMADRIPLIGVNKIDAPTLDLEFTLIDRENWRRLAALIIAFAERRGQIVDALAASEAADDRLLCSLFVHRRAWRDGIGLLQEGGEQGLAAVVYDLVSKGLLQPAAIEPDSFELSPAGLRRITGGVDVSGWGPGAGHGGGVPASQQVGATVTEIGSPPTPTGTRILVLENDDFAREVMGSVLSAAGYSASVARFDDAAARVLDAGMHDIVVLPVEAWPPVEGAAHAFLSTGIARRDTVVIAVAPARNGFADEMLASGRVQGVLMRPLAPRALLDLVMKLSAETSSKAAAFDESTFADLTELVGESAAARLVEKLSGQLLGRFIEPSYPDAGSEGLRADAHAIKGSAAMLGMMRLSQLCGELERACEAKSGVGAALSRVLQAREVALTRLERLGSDLSKTPIAAA